MSSNPFLSQEKVSALERQISEAQQTIEAARQRGSELLTHANKQKQQLDDYFKSLLRENAERAMSVSEGQDVSIWGSWLDDRWEGWEPAEASLQPIIRVGAMVEEREFIPPRFNVPATIPFIGANRTIIIQCSNRTTEVGLELLRAVLIRTALMLPHQTRYTLLDPAGNGMNFPMRRHLPMVRDFSGDVRRDLDLVIKDVQRIIETYLDAKITSFDKVNETIRANERFEFVFAADFPNKYDRRAIEALQSLGNTGPAAGTYTFIHYNKNHELPRDMGIEGFENSYIIDVDALEAANIRALTFIPESDPDPDLQEDVFEALRSAKPPERTIHWEGVVGTLNSKDWWTETSDTIIETPIGSRGSGERDRLIAWFGVGREGNPCAHGMLGAMTGAGKSNLYHVLLYGLATRYSPQELRFYLIDGKDGVEFQPYRDLPHAEAVSLRSSPDLSRSVLAELLDEKERRNSLFSDAKVTDFTGYRKVGQPGGNIPRILLLIDEYQELFEGDKDGTASNQLMQLAQQGRSVGIHMLLASQRFGAAGMLNQTAIFGNVHLRMAMQMTRSDIEALTEFGRQGRHLILMTCNLPGKIVLNDRSGDDAANQAGKVAFLPGETRMTLLNVLNEKANKEFTSDELPQTVVFDGKEQPNLVENPQILKLMKHPKRLTPEEIEAFARKPIHEGGLEIIDWFAAERPAAIWLGQEFNVRGQAVMALRRRVSEHGLIIGSTNPARYGMLAASLVSLALNSCPDDIEFFVVDRTIPGTPWSDTLSLVCSEVLQPAGYQVTFITENKDVEGLFDTVTEELERRRDLSEDELSQQPSIFLVMTELERIDELRRRPDAYGMSDVPLGEKLQRLYMEGSPLGIHLILSFSGVRPLSHIMDTRHGLYNFRHRVTLQMSEDESHTLVRSRKAAQLQLEGPVPICALYMDMETDRSIRFKPYSTESKIEFSEQLQTISEYLKEWD